VDRENEAMIRTAQRIKRSFVDLDWFGIVEGDAVLDRRGHRNTITPVQPRVRSPPLAMSYREGVRSPVSRRCRFRARRLPAEAIFIAPAGVGPERTAQPNGHLAENICGTIRLAIARSEWYPLKALVSY
jgi:hypothetical protein